jgi:DNA-binding transcriptional ArsR family regulator
MSAANSADDQGEIRAIFERHDDPVLTTSEVGDALDVSRRTALRKLTALEDAGVLTRKEVGPRGSVWWPVDANTEPEYMKGFGTAEGTDYREAVAEVREELDEELEERTDAVF